MPSTLLIVENASVPTDPRVWPECLTLRDEGWNVTVIGPRGRTRDRAAFEVINEIRVHRFPMGNPSGGFRGYLAEYASASRQVQRLVVELARRESFDVVHAATPPDFLLLAARRLRARGVATILDHHDLSPELFEVKFGHRGPIYAGLLAAERVGFRLADVVISTNDSFRRIAIERGHQNPEDVFVVRNGPDTTVFRPQDPDPELRRLAKYLIGYVGLMGTQDGVLEALEALGLLALDRRDWHAIFVGDGEVLPRARELKAHLGLEDCVSFLGFVGERDRVARIIASCDVCISPEPPNALNDHSTLIKVAEYLSVGKPVIAFDLKETAFTAQDAAVRARTRDEFAALISVLLDDEPRRRRMGALGRERVLDELGWHRSRGALLAAYERALANARRRQRGDSEPRRPSGQSQ